MLPHSNKFIFSLLLVMIFGLVHRAAAENTYVATRNEVEPIGHENPLKLQDLMTKSWDSIEFIKKDSNSGQNQVFSLFQVVQNLNTIPVCADSSLEIHLLEKLKDMHDNSERTRTISLLILLLTVFLIVILVVIVGLLVHLLKS